MPPLLPTANALRRGYDSNAAPPLPHGVHVHVCPCGSALYCKVSPDHCPIGAHWTCPACERLDLDDWMSRKEGFR